MIGADRSKPVYQRDVTGCAIACTAWLAGKEYSSVKKTAGDIGIDITNPSLWSETIPMRSLLSEYGIKADSRETLFTTWQNLPPLALLAVKWHLERGKPHWHWVVYSRKAGETFVMDPKKALKTNIRTDFGRIKPKWYIDLSP